jgi:hypothetical protein
MADLQDPPCEGIDVFDKVFAGGNFPLHIVFSTDRGRGKDPARFRYKSRHLASLRHISGTDTLCSLKSTVS